MSLIGSLLALVLIPLKAKVTQPAPPNLEAWEAALDHWRNAYEVLWRENERLRDERDAARAQLRSLADLQGRQLLGYAQAQQAAQAQQNQLAQYQGLYNPVQNALGNSQWHDCTCVPARSKAFGDIR